MIGKFGQVIASYLKDSSGDTVSSLFKSALPEGLQDSGTGSVLNLLK